MSTEKRLKRLGLWHLRDKPDELTKALEEGLDERRRLEQEWEVEAARIRSRRAAAAEECPHPSRAEAKEAELDGSASKPERLPRPSREERRALIDAAKASLGPKAAKIPDEELDELLFNLSDD